MPDYLRTARLLRAKAASPVVPATERAALLERAAALESKYGNRSSTTTNDTTVESRDGRPFNPFERPAGWVPPVYMWDTLWDLHRNQAQWNAPPPREEEDIVEEEYAYEPEDEDNGYDIYESEEWQ